MSGLILLAGAASAQTADRHLDARTILEAHDLITTHVPEVVPILRKMWHFGYAVRYDRLSEWEANACRALFGALGAPPVATTGDCNLEPATVSIDRACSRQSSSQREIMQRLFVERGRDIERTIAAYADAERSGEARRMSNDSKLNAEQYARALLKDGLRKGWLKE